MNTAPRQRINRAVWPAFVGLMLLAAFFRFYRLADHPLGIFYDAATNGLDAFRLMQHGGLTPFIPTNGGREALFVYLLIPFIRLFGTTPLAVHALSASLSLLAVALLFGFICGMRRLNFNSPGSDFPLKSGNLWLAALTGLTLATMPWHIAVSRLGVRTVLVAVFSVPMFWLFLKGWITGQRRWFIFSGLLMGLIGYTYSSARLLPVILALAVLPEFLLHRTHLKTRLTNLLLFIISAIIIYLPLAWYFFLHPTLFTTRSGSVMVWNFVDTPAAAITELGRNTARVLGFFCCRSSDNPIFGLSGWPGLAWLLTPFLLIGLLATIRKWRHLFYRLIVLWWLIGLVPTLIAIEAPHPLRMMMAVVPTAILVGLGLTLSANWLWKKVSNKETTRNIFYVIPILIILATVPGTYRTYFVEWPQRQDMQGAYDYGAVALRDAILNHPDPAAPIYLPLTRFNTAPLLFYLSQPFARQAALQVPAAERAWVITPERNEQDAVWVRLHQGTATILPPLTTDGQRMIQTALADESTIPIRTISGETIARMVHLPTDPAQFVQQPTQPLTANFGPARLTGAAYPITIDLDAGQIPVTLFWQANAPMTDEYDVILQLVDDDRQVWGNGSGRPNDWAYPTTFWQPGVDEIAALHTITLESNPPPGRYWLAISLFNPVTQQRLPLTEGAGDSPDTFFAGPLKVSLPGQASIPSLTDPVAFGDVARLSGVEVEPLTISPGQAINITLQWNVLKTPSRDYTVFIHLLDQDGNLIAGHDSQPGGGRYPTTIWTPDEQIIDTHTLPTPNTLPAGSYHLAVGLYHQPTEERLPITLADGQPIPKNRLLWPTPIIVD